MVSTDLISEGKAKFYASQDKAGKISKELKVFYNPVMKFNRDMSVLLLNSSGLKDMQIADIMAGSGVRSLRFLSELNKGIIKNISINDYDPNFISHFKKNLRLNKIKKTKKIEVTSEDANMFLLKSKGFDYIEIDPFGSPNPFLDASVVRLSRGGILAVTATDTAPLSGTFPATCKRNYWGRPIRNHMMHEIGIRILIRKVQLIGAQHDKALIPIFSYFKDHYFRIFFKCIKSKEECDRVLAQHKFLLYCGCMNFRISEQNSGICELCSRNMEHAGPLWVGKLSEQKLIDSMLKKNKDEINGRFLTTVAEEIKKDIVGFYDVHEVCKKYKKTIPNFEILFAKLIESGHFASRTHFSVLGVRTDMKLNEFLGIIDSI